MNQEQSLLRVLVVDDVQEDLMLAERVLRQCKVLNPIQLMKTGEECIAYFRKRAGSSRELLQPCLLFLDLMMTPTSGLIVLRALRDDKLASDSILVMLSGITDIKAIHEGYQLGARTFLVKPIEPADVVGLLSALKEKVRIEEQPEGHLLHSETGDTSISQPGDTTHISRVMTMSV